jgi:glucose-1-phosphate thymidylyltransferase
MKGIVLAGGMGTRLAPLTYVTNKHLLPVFDRPMVDYPLECLITAGIDEIMIVTGGEHAGDFLKLMGNGERLGLRHLNYTYQKGHGGIAEALGLCEHWADGDAICVILGDNIFEYQLRPGLQRFAERGDGAMVFLKEVHDPERFGVATLEGGKVVEIVEKPSTPKSNWAVTGAYCYDASVFETIKTLEPSERGELEITDVNNAYLRQGKLAAHKLDGWWTDAGTFESLLRAGNMVAKSGANKPSE